MQPSAQLPCRVIHWCHWNERENVLNRDSFVELAIWHKVLTERSARKLPNSLPPALVLSLTGQISRAMGVKPVGTFPDFGKPRADRIWSEPGPKPSQCASTTLQELSFSPSPSQVSTTDRSRFEDDQPHLVCGGATSLTAVDHTKITSPFDKDRFVFLLIIVLTILPSLSIITLS